MRRLRKRTVVNNHLPQTNSIEINKQEKSLYINLKKNIQIIQETLGNSSDIIIRQISIGQDRDVQVSIIFVDGLSNSSSLNDFVLESLLFNADFKSTTKDPFHVLKELVISVGELKEVGDFETLLAGVLSGDPAILLNGYTTGFLVGLKGWEERGVQEPSSQTVIRGPREGFSENIRFNTALVRRKIKDSTLRLEEQQIGRVTKTVVALMYIHGIVDETVIKEVRQRLSQIKIDGILESGYIEELIQDHTYTPFPTIFNTERPDTAAAALLEGRVVILIDGTPFVLIVPAIFPQFLQSAEDYYQRSEISSLLRLLRFISIFITFLAPSMFIAVTAFHYEMLPQSLLINLTEQREGVPFPLIIEALLMEATFELLREAGIRMPRAVGQAISIVGALVIGQAAVEAGLVSPAMVIVVAITAITSFAIPAYNMANAFRILRFGMMILAASFGLFGIILGMILMVQHLCSLRSFGIPFMSPYAPSTKADYKDTMIRVPWGKMISRPQFMDQINVLRNNNRSKKR
ncbi:spore germination protein [Alkalihalobacillus deserti]|uniref:spore germination protein n=1 Tax=Alkalihalobacillus deserti TaxID=2879466 RepID=UPI001D148B28|nr:spore germination protein [Alkalihalobacillus deserti]